MHWSQVAGIVALVSLAVGSFAAPQTTPKKSMQPKTFADDVAFLKKYQSTIVLRSTSGAAVAVVPAWQGRVMTSTVDASRGNGNGWINYDLIASKKLLPHINVFGGEDRFWLGPEGGQYSLFFKNGDAFDLAHWQTPPLIDTEPFTVSTKSLSSVTFRREAKLTNYYNTTFDIIIDRTVRLISDADVRKLAGIGMGSSVKTVAYESVNTVTNKGKEVWDKGSGMPSIWILGMYKPSPTTTIIVPVQNAKPGDKVVTDTYFGKVPASRLQQRGNLVLFRGDGQYRSKIGIPPAHAFPRAGSYDPAGKMLTVIEFTLPKGATDYVNSLWEIQDKPFGGDAVNSYNDGPPAPGKKPLGPFYELESSSPAAALAPGKSITHVHRTMHFIGSEAELDKIAQRLLGASLKVVRSTFK